MSLVRSGLGFDLHPFVDARPLVLGGVTVPHAASTSLTVESASSTAT